MIKAVAILAFVAAAQAISTGNAYLNPHVGVQGEQTVRGYGGLNTVSHQSKSVVSPHSHATSSDSRVTNAALAAYAAPAYAHGYAAPAVAAHGYAAPAYSHGYAAPALAAHGYAAPAIAAHGYAAPALAHGYAAPAYSHGYAAPALAAHGYAAPALAHGYAAPALAHGYAAAPVAKVGLLGTAYSAVAPGVATHTFSRTYEGYGNLAYSY